MKTVSPVVEKAEDELDVEEKDDESDHQSSPLNDPPRPTVPIREKSTWGRFDGAGVAAMTGMRNGKRSNEGKLSDMVKRDARMRMGLVKRLITQPALKTGGSSSCRDGVMRRALGRTGDRVRTPKRRCVKNVEK